MTEKRFHFIRLACALVFGVVMSFTFAGDARAQDGALDSELSTLEAFIPGLKALREFSNSLDEKMARLRRPPAGTTSGNTGGRRAPVEEAEELPSESPGTLPDPEIERQLRAQTLAAVTSALREQNKLVDNARTQLRLYVSVSVDKCKQYLASGDMPGARANCIIADNKIEQCKRQVAPEINQLAARLNAKYLPSRDVVSTFSTIECDLVFAGLDDPGRLLRQADQRLPDSACYAHIDRVESYVKTGIIQSRLGADDANVPAYLAYIRRMCPERIAQQAQEVVDEAMKLKEAADRKLAEDEAKKAQADTPAQEAAIALPRRGGNSGSNLFQSAIDQAEQDERDPSARIAREREASARAAEARAAEQERARRSEQNARELREGLGQVLGVLAQSQQANQNRLPEQQRRTQGQPQTSSQPEMGIISDSTGDSRRPTSTASSDTSAWRAQQERDAAERNRRVREADDQMRRRNDAQIEAIRNAHHPQNVGNHCVHVIVDRYNTQVFQNDCPWAVSILWPGGLWDISQGGQYPTFQKGNFSFLACKHDRNGAGIGKGNVCRD